METLKQEVKHLLRVKMRQRNEEKEGNINSLYEAERLVTKDLTRLLGTTKGQAWHFLFHSDKWFFHAVLVSFVVGAKVFCLD